MSKENLNLIDEDPQMLTEDAFRKIYQFEEEKENRIKDFLVNNCKCSRQSFFNFFPILKWLKKYSPKQNLLRDILAGVTIAVLHIPHGLAYAPLGKAEPVVGLYMAIFPVLIYIFMGTSKHLSLGTFAVICAMTGDVVGKYESFLGNDTVRLPYDHTHITNGSLPKRYDNVQVGTALAFMVGVWQTCLGVLKLGFCTVILSESLVSGFTTAAAFHVFSLQLKNLFGVTVYHYSGPFKLFYLYNDFFKNFPTANLVATAISIVCISILIFFTRFVFPLLQRRFPHKKIMVPLELVVLFFGNLTSYFLNLHENYGVHIVEEIPKGVPVPRAPPMDLLPQIAFDGLIMAILSVAMNLSLAKIIADKDGYDISNNQEFFAYGFGNIFASFFNCIPASASLSRSIVQFVAGGKTQLCNLFSGFIILTIILYAGFIFEPVPYCVLSSIVVSSLINLFYQVEYLGIYWEISKPDLVVWVGTFLSVIILDLEYGLGLGIVMSALNVIYISSEVKVSEMGRIFENDVFVDKKMFKAAEEVPDFLILRITGQLSFINYNTFESKTLEKFKNFLNSTESASSHVIISMSGVTHIDCTSVKSLKVIYDEVVQNSTDLYFTDCNAQVFDALEKNEFFQIFPRHHVFATLKDVINYLRNE